MSDSESVDYLQDDFDPKTLTIPRLRSILVTYDISYPSTAKKQQLIDIFNDKVVPQSGRIIAQRARAKRSSYGIVNIDDSQSTSLSTQDRMAPTPVVDRARSPRKTSTRVKKESVEPEALIAPATTTKRASSPRKRAVRSMSRQLLSETESDSHVERKKPGRKARTPQPMFKEEEESSADDRVLHSTEPAAETQSDAHDHDADKSVFTSDNPFQSGSSPLAPVATPSHRRRTTHDVESVRKATSSASASAARRRTDGEQKVDERARASKSPAMPLIQRMRTKTPEPTLEAGEEFTPDEQLELSQEDADRANMAVVPVQHSTRGGSRLTTPLWVLLMTLLSAYGAWYRQEKVAVGYCGVGRPATEVIPRNIRELDFEIPDWAVSLAEPQCEPCPMHAICHEDFSVSCETDFVLRPHPLSLGGLVPLPPTCEPDGEKVRRVKAVADKAIEELREHRAKYECGGELGTQDSGSGVGAGAGAAASTGMEVARPATPAMLDTELKAAVSAKRSKKLSQREFDDLWAAALGEIEAREEVEVQTRTEPNPPHPGAVSHTLFTSTSLARLPLLCAVRRSLRLAVARHRVSLISLTLSILSILYARARIISYRATSAQIPALVDLVLDRLASQKEVAYDDDDDLDDPFLFLPNLRDDVLRGVHKLSERERIWLRVKGVVEQNSNVRTAQREGRNGEMGRAWEWIGPSASAIAESGGGMRRRRSGRVSFGPGVKGGLGFGDDERGVVESSPIQRQEREREERREGGSGGHRRWEEPGARPIY